MAIKKVNLSIPEELYVRLEEYCESSRLPKSTLAQIAIEQYLDQMEARKNMLFNLSSNPDVMVSLAKALGRSVSEVETEIKSLT